MTDTIQKVRCLIIGSGPAGYTAAIYTARADLNPVLYEGMQPGGQLTITTEIENFPGYPKGVSGPEMMEDFRNQALRFKVDIRTGEIAKVDLSQHPFTAVDDRGQVIKAESIIIATGASAKWLGLESEQRFFGQGVSACATCDGFFYKGQEVVVVGGGDTACEEASYLANICKKVYLVVRRDELRASKAMQNRVKTCPNIEILWHHVTEEILGDNMGGVNGAMLKNLQTGEQLKLDISGFFVAIGHQPNVELFKGQIDLTEQEYIITKPNSMATNVRGVFAAGDVQDMIYRQAITAAGTGCMAAIEAERFLHEESCKCECKI